MVATGGSDGVLRLVRGGAVEAEAPTKSAITAIETSLCGDHVFTSLTDGTIITRHIISTEDLANERLIAEVGGGSAPRSPGAHTPGGGGPNPDRVVHLHPVGPATHCSPRHRMPRHRPRRMPRRMPPHIPCHMPRHRIPPHRAQFNSRNDGS